MSATSLDRTVEAPSGKPAERQRPDILAFVSDAATEALLSECLTEMRAPKAVVRRMTCEQTRDHLRRNRTPKVLIVDIGAIDRPQEALSALADVVEPDVKVLVVGDRSDAYFYRHITRDLGVTEYVYRPLSRAMVMRLFAPHIVEADHAYQPVRGARIVTITGARGGVGATTVATNLAWYVAEEAGRHTLAVDFNLRQGAMGLLLGGQVNGGLKAALEAPDRIDQLLIERGAQHVGKRLDLLSSLIDLNEQAEYGAEAMTGLLDTVSAKYNYVIAEIGPQPMPARKALAQRSHQNIIVMDPTLLSVRETVRLLSAPRPNSQGMRPLIVANQVGRPGTLTKEEVEKGLGRKPDIHIPFNPRALGTAEAEGVPAFKTAEAFRSAIRLIAQEALSVQVKDAGGRKSLSILRRLWSRTS